MSSTALTSFCTDIDNWLLGFDAVSSAEEIQRQYVCSNGE